MRPVLHMCFSMLLLGGATGCRNAAKIDLRDTDGARSPSGEEGNGDPEHLTRRHPGPCEAYTVTTDPTEGSPKPFRRQWFAYDDGGWLAYTATDSGADGTVDRQVWYVNDDAGQVLLHEADDTGDGVIDWRYRYGFDASGRETLSARDGDGDGFYERSTRTEYDDGGNVVSVETDSNGDGAVNSFCYTTIDDIGNPLIRNCNDVIHRWINTYDERGNLILSAYDARDDGTIDSTSEYTYDNDDRIVEESQTKHYDTGTEQLVQLYKYDDRGKVVQKSSSKTSSYGASSDIVSSMTYFDNGNMASSQTISSGISSGMPFFKTASSDYNDEGVLIRYESSGYYNGASSGALERYRNDGRLLEVTRFDTAGPYTSTTTNAYDGFGNITSTSEDLPSGVYYTEYAYDCFE